MVGHLPLVLRLPLPCVAAFFLGLPALYAAGVLAALTVERRLGYVQKRFEGECLALLAVLIAALAIGIELPSAVAVPLSVLVFGAGICRALAAHSNARRASKSDGES